MNVKTTVFLGLLLLTSVVMLVFPLIGFGISVISEKKTRNFLKKAGSNRVLAFSAFLLGSIWCMRYAVGCYEIVHSQSGGITITWWEEIFNSLVHALQTFSMDEDYTQYILSGKQLVRDIFGVETGWERVYGFYASVLNAVAPIAGGAIILEILAGVFPRVRLMFTYLIAWKEKYFFSELNECSLALAKSICDTKELKNPIIIFTDVYVDSQSEQDSELLQEAKRIGAICVRDDMTHVRKNRFGMRKFFLIDTDEAGSLQTLAELTNARNYKFLKKAEIFLFTNHDAYIQLEKRVYDRLMTDLHFSEEDMPVFVPVKSYRNMIADMLVDIPLYEPLVGKKAEPDGSRVLTVTIMGTGNIGVEMFLSTYWIGQILNCRLEINILSQETEEQFWNKIDYVNPEIRQTTVDRHKVLRVNSKGDFADVYCRVNYIPCDIKSSAFVDCLTDTESKVLKTDYFLVALGSDEDNISTADTIRRYVGAYHLAQKEDLHTVITYVVYNQELSQMLNKKVFFSSDNQKTDIFMQAIGSLQAVYSYQNVFLTGHMKTAQIVQNAYSILQGKQLREKTHRDRMKDDYKYWANMARSMHVGYKAFSMGCVKHSRFDERYDTAAYREKLAQSYADAKDIATGKTPILNPEEAQRRIKLLHEMAWLEHRRWCAFTRVKGYRFTDAYSAYKDESKGSYKHMDLKLHPCLVECDKKGIRASMDHTGTVDAESLHRWKEWEDLDLLDELSRDLYDAGINDYDFKIYDYPMFSFSE